MVDYLCWLREEAKLVAPKERGKVVKKSFNGDGRWTYRASQAQEAA